METHAVRRVRFPRNPLRSLAFQRFVVSRIPVLGLAGCCGAGGGSAAVESVGGAAWPNPVDPLPATARTFPPSRMMTLSAVSPEPRRRGCTPMASMAAWAATSAGPALDAARRLWAWCGARRGLTPCAVRRARPRAMRARLSSMSVRRVSRARCSMGRIEANASSTAAPCRSQAGLLVRASTIRS